MLTVFFLCHLAASFVLTAVMRRYAITRSLVDIPGARSSHQVPTPRGGGIATVITLLIGIAYLVFAGALDSSIALSIGGAGLVVAIIGFWDDHGHLPARWRLIGHFLAAGWGLYWLGGLPEIVVWTDPLSLGWAGHILAAVFLVWLLNLYNFMDGINGIASLEAITVIAGGGTLYWLVSDGTVHPLFVAAMGSTIGFLVWNFPRARIFMGDACSGFLGLFIGLTAMWQAQFAPELFAAWIILLAVFITDATATLIRRVIRGDKFYEAHRSHAYQNASRLFGSHTPVSLGVAIINLFWLLPVGILVVLGGVPVLVGIVIAYAPIAMLVFYYKAGARELQDVVGRT